MEFLTMQYKKHDVFLQYRKAVFQTCSVKKLLLKISQNSQESISARVFFKTSPAAASGYQNLTQMKM